MKNIAKNSAKIFLGLFFFLSFLSPLIGVAQEQVGDQAVTSSSSLWERIKMEEGKYTFIVPLGPFASILEDTTELRTGDALVKYLRTWFKFLIGVGGVIGVARLVMVGFSIITSAGNVNAVSKIKEEITTIAISLILVAGSWVFLNTLNPALVNSSLIINKTTSSSTRLVIDEDPPGTPDEDVKSGLTSPGFTIVMTDTKTGKKSNIGPFKDPEDCQSTIDAYKKSEEKPEVATMSDKCYDHTNFNITADELSLRKFLASNNVYPNKSSCLTANQTDCTRIEGLGQAILNEVVNIATKCCGKQPECKQGRVYNGNVCPIVITGGTEAGHGSHGPNIPDVLDLKYTGKLAEYLKSNSTIIANSFCNNKRFYIGGYWYTDEIYGKGCKTTERHFHVCAEKSSSKSTGCSPIDQAVLDNERQCRVNSNNTVNPTQKVCT